MPSHVSAQLTGICNCDRDDVVVVCHQVKLGADMVVQALPEGFSGFDLFLYLHRSCV